MRDLIKLSPLRLGCLLIKRLPADDRHFWMDLGLIAVGSPPLLGLTYAPLVEFQPRKYVCHHMNK